MSTEILIVNGVEVTIDSPTEAAADVPTLLMLHGWPDSKHLWQGQVEALRNHARCVRFTWPGFNANDGAMPRSLDEHVALIAAVADAVSPGVPIVLVQHDWGCIFGYEYAARHSDRVQKIVAMDIGDYNSSAFVKSLPLPAKLAAAGYQLWLATAWLLGHHLGLKRGADALTRFMAKALHAPGDRASIHFGMNHPYAMTWFGTSGGFGGAAKNKAPTHPMLYIHGLKKPFQFQSKQWMDAVSARSDSRALSLDAGHWMMLSRAELVTAAILDWAILKR